MPLGLKGFFFILFLTSLLILGVVFVGFQKFTEDFVKVSEPQTILNKTLSRGTTLPEDYYKETYLNSNSDETLSGKLSIFANSQGQKVGEGLLYLSAPVAEDNSTLFGISVGEIPLFRIDSEGDITAKGDLTTKQLTTYNLNSTSLITDNLTTEQLTTNNLTTNNLAAGNITGSAQDLTNLDASNLSQGIVPSERMLGAYSNITGLGAIVLGTWQGTPIEDGYISDNITASNYLPLSGGTISGNLTTNNLITNNLSAGSISGQTISASSQFIEGGISLSSKYILIPSSSTQGDILYHDGLSWKRLPSGTSGQLLRTMGAAANPQWATVSFSTVGGWQDNGTTVSLELDTDTVAIGTATSQGKLTIRRDTAGSALAIRNTVDTSTLFSINELGEITAGAWKGTAIAAQYGGTGLNTSASTGIPKLISGVWSINATTSDLGEGTNLYYTDTRFDTRLGAKTTDNLTEGAANLYYTDVRSQAALSGTSPIVYNSGNGDISFSSSYIGQASITTVGTLTSGSIGSGFTLIADDYISDDLTITSTKAGSFTHSGASAGLTVTQSGTGAIVNFTNTASATATAFALTNLGTGLSFRVNDENGEADATPFVIAASGDVGIGTTAPNQLLHLSKEGDAALNFEVVGSNLSLGIGPNNGGTFADDSSVGTVVWSNPSNAQTSNDTYALAGMAADTISHYLKATDFSFTIPTGATINGILVEIEKKKFGSGMKDYNVKIVKGGTISGDDKADTVNQWPNSDAYSSYGGSSNLWGLTWSSADINANNFGIAISSICDTFSTFAFIDHIRITIYYQDATVNWALGGDKSDSSRFKLSYGSSLGTNDYLTIDTSGNMGIGAANPSSKLDISQNSASAALTVTQSSIGNIVNLTGDSITTGTGLALSVDGLTTGTGLDISSTSTAGGTSGSSKLFNLARSGANSNASHTAYGLYSAITNTGTTSTNVAGYFSASGATNNYGLIVENGSVGIGTTAPSKELTIIGSAEIKPKNPVIVSSLYSTNFAGTGYNYVVGKYVYLTGLSADTFNIVDISDPTNPVIVSTTTDARLDGTEGVYVAGKYAYVNGIYADTFNVIDISNPKSPSIVGSITDNTKLNAIEDVHIAGKYAYTTVALTTSNQFSIIDISNPTNPSIVATITDDRLNNGGNVYVVGKYAYVTGRTADSLNVIDISDPTNPSIVGSVTSTTLDGALDVQVSGRYAYVTAEDADTFNVIDISDPTNPSIVASIQDSTYLNGPYDIKVVGNYVFIGVFYADRLTIVDISNPANPFISGSIQDSTLLDGADHIDVAGKYVYVSANNGSRLTIIEIDGLTASGIQASTISAGNINISASMDIAQSLYVGSSLNIGHGGLLSAGSLSVAATSTPSYFGGNVGIGTTTPGEKLDVNGTGTVYGRIISTTTGSINEGGLYLVRGDQANGYAQSHYWTGATNVWATGLRAGDANYHIFQVGTTNLDRMVIDASGNVGIGTATPSSKIDINGVIRTISDNVTPTSGTGLELQYSISLDSGVVVAYNRTSSAYKKLIIDGSSILLGPNSGGNVGIGIADPGAYKLHVEGGMIAQSYATGHIIESRIHPKEGEIFEVGDILSITNPSETNPSESASTAENIRFAKSTQSYDKNLIGVADYNETDGFRPVFAGVFEAKVSLENGPIAVGDPLTSASLTPGVAMKATKPGRVIGIALEPFNGTTTQCETATTTEEIVNCKLKIENSLSQGKVMVFINPHWQGDDLSVGENEQGKIVNLEPEVLKSGLASLGLIISENGVLEVETLKAKKVITEEFEIRDKATGKIYCAWLENGEWVKVKGECQSLNDQAPVTK